MVIRKDRKSETARRLRACPQHRTQATQKRSKVYWSWPLLLHAQGQRGNSYIRLHPENINRDSGIEIPEAWMSTIKKHNNRRAARANHRVKQQGSKCANQSCWKTTDHSRASCIIGSRMTSRPHRLKKTISMQSKRRDLHHTWLHRETNEKLSFYCYFPRWITTTSFTQHYWSMVRSRWLNIPRVFFSCF